MKPYMYHWVCDSCGLQQQGVITSDGDFISDKELDNQPDSSLRATGCAKCGCNDGRVSGDPDGFPVVA